MPSPPVRLARSTPELRAGFDRIRLDFDVPDGFAAPVELAATHAAQRGVPHASDRRDARDLELVTIDPKGSRDLDQAYGAERRGDGYRIWYAIADVSAFVDAHDAVDAEARRRGVTLYLPDQRALLYPAGLSEGAASLLPKVDRPCVLWTIDLDAAGAPTSWHLERAVVRSREALSYREVGRMLDAERASEPLRLLREVGLLREEQERARGGVSIAVPTQEVRRRRDGYELVYDTEQPVEGWNAQISLVTGMCAAEVMVDAGAGILRTLPPIDAQAVGRLRPVARALGIEWPETQSYADVVRGLRPEEPAHAAFLTQAVQTLRGAGYSLVPTDGAPPAQHGALAAVYAHVTAPLRRLADRFANEVVLAHLAGEPVPGWALDALPSMPEVMDETGRHAAAVSRAVVDLVEAVVLAPRVGEVLTGTVVDLDDDRVTVLLRSPAVIARLDGTGYELGSQLDLRLIAADPVARRVELEPVAR
jgi:exoribonuclease R